MKNLKKPILTCSEENSNITEPCLVCGSPTSTLHYQIIICYACAAFYRRSNKTHQAFVCQRNDKKCDIVNRKSGKPMCRYCRYQKCLTVGIKGQNTAEKDNNKMKEEIFPTKKHSENLPEHEKPISESFDEIFETAFKILEGQCHFSTISTKINCIEDFSKIFILE